MKKIVLLFIICCFAVTAGCSATHPKLRFLSLDPNYDIQNNKDKYIFKMPRPVITISAQKDENATPPWKPAFTSTVNSRPGVYAIKSEEPWYIDAKFAIAYQQNSFLLKSFGIDLTDNRVKYIQQLGAIAVAAIPLVIAMAPADPLEALRKNLPYNVDVAVCFGTTLDSLDAREKVSCEIPIGDSGWKVEIVTDRNDETTISYDKYFTKEGVVSTNFPVPDCKEGFVSLVFQSERKFVSPITFANPTKLAAVVTPSKGSITFHPICSADTAYDTADVATPLELLKTTIDQVKAAEQAYRDAKK
jgi:hypothetical protein